ncbi:hypothetical protein ONZ45_g7968 [Pleurotus djamor]|nr:hypothetical protein ONZ45_g7968 [Pleurotus djamor]
MCFLQSLPTEVLEFVLGEVECDGLFKLALLSRRFHYIALPLYLSRRGIKDYDHPDCTITFQSDRMRAIRAVRMALFITHVKQFSFVFGYPAETLLEEIRQATRLLQRPNLRIDAIQLNFAKLDLWGLGEQLMGNTMHLVPPNEWFTALRATLEAAAISGCKRFSVLCGQTYWLKSEDSFVGMRLSPQTRMKKFVRLVKSTVKKLVQRTPTPSQHITFSSHMQDFELSNSPTFLHPQMREWTIRALLNSTITSLSICGLGTTRSEWTALLPRLNLPCLTSLRMKDMWVYSDDLTKLLTRHPSITSLTLFIVPHPPNKRRPTSIANPTFPNLTHITASIDVISKYLSSAAIAPKLRSVTLLHSTNGTATFYEIDKLLLPIHSRLQDVALLLNLKITEPTPQWVSKNIDEKNAGTQLAVLRHLRQLELYHEFFYFSFSADTVASMPSLLSVFPSLEEVKFPAISWMTGDGAKTFADSFEPLCGSIKSVSVNGKTYLVPNSRSPTLVGSSSTRSSSDGKPTLS